MLLDDVRAFLVAYGIAWPVTEGYLPPETDQAVAVFEYSGIPATEILRETEEVSIMTRVRGLKFDYTATRVVWKQVYDLLQDAHETSGSPLYLPGVVYIQAKHSNPNVIYDANERPNFVSNWRVRRYRD